MENEKRWQCKVCGYVEDGPEPPKRCMKCGAERSKFISYK